MALNTQGSSILCRTQEDIPSYVPRRGPFRHLQPQRSSPRNPLQCQARRTNTKHRQRPRVGCLPNLGPETVLSLFVLGEFLGLGRTGLGIALCLGGFIGSVAADVA